MIINGLKRSKRLCAERWTDKDEREFLFVKGHKREAESINTIFNAPDIKSHIEHVRKKIVRINTYRNQQKAIRL
jgi:hypothetical protein